MELRAQKSDVLARSLRDGLTRAFVQNAPDVRLPPPRQKFVSAPALGRGELSEVTDRGGDTWGSVENNTPRRKGAIPNVLTPVTITWVRLDAVSFIYW